MSPNTLCWVQIQSLEQGPLGNEPQGLLIHNLQFVNVQDTESVEKIILNICGILSIPD